MTEPVYFVVEKRNGREYATVHREHLQPGGAAVYTLRLDKLPDPERWTAMPLTELYALYRQLRDAGQLPPPNVADAPKKGEAAKRLIGDYWEPAWVHDRPYPLIASGASGQQPPVQPDDGRSVFLKGGKP